MLRRSFLKRMALAAAACAFIDVPWPKRERLEVTRKELFWSKEGPFLVQARTPADAAVAQQTQDYLNWVWENDPAWRERLREIGVPW